MNAFESAVMAEKLPESADIVIVNTCAVTAEAERQGVRLYVVPDVNILGLPSLPQGVLSN